MTTAAASEDRALWVWVSLVPMGLGSWAPIYAGARAGRQRWIWLGALWSLLTAVGWVLAAVYKGGSGGGFFIIAGWVGGIATSFAIRDAYRRTMGSSFEGAVTQAEQEVADRKEAQRVAREEPEVAREMGIGRPDLPGAKHADVVDINNAPASAIARLPGVDDALAARIVGGRSATGFTSVEDLGAAVDLDASVVDALRDQTVFLPRAG